MELTNIILYMNVSGVQFVFRKNDETKKWIIDDKQVVLKGIDINKQIKIFQDVVAIVASLDAGATEADLLNNIANNFDVEPVADVAITDPPQAQAG